MLDVAWALVTEIYGQYEMKFEDAQTELRKQTLGAEEAKRPQQVAADNAASMAMLQSMMGDSTFKGPRG